MESPIVSEHCGLDYIAHGKVDDERYNTRMREIDLGDDLARLAKHIASPAFSQGEVRLERFENLRARCCKKPIWRMIHAPYRCLRRERGRVSRALAAQMRPAMLRK